MRKKSGVMHILPISLFLILWSLGVQATPERLAPAGKEYLRALSDAFAEAAEKVKPAVVSIVSVRKVRYTAPQFDFPGDFFQPFRDFWGEDFFERFFQRRFPEMEPREFESRNMGSGVIIDSKNGYILTNNHVVAEADEINVMLLDKRSFSAKVKGRDTKTDIALLKIDGKDLPEAELGDSDQIRVGDWVLAIGNPFELYYSVTAGVVSAKGRGVGITGLGGQEYFIQTDAAINPGNSGGPLIDLEGKVVGINTAIATRTGGYQGVGFAIPINLAKEVMEELLSKGKVVRGWLGVMIKNLTPEDVREFKTKDLKGALVVQVNADSPAEKAGIKPGDIILEVDEKEVIDTTELRNIIARVKPGTEIDIVVLREGKEKTLSVKVGEQPEEVAEPVESRRAAEDKFGIKVAPITPELRQKYEIPQELKGVVVVGIAPGSAAAGFGIREGDVIVEVNRKAITNVDEYCQQIEKAAKAGSVFLIIKSKEGSRFVILQAR